MALFGNPTHHYKMAIIDLVSYINDASALVDAVTELILSIFRLLMPITLMTLSLCIFYFVFWFLRHWLHRRAAEKKARELIGRFDTHQVDFLGSLEDAGVIDVDGNTMQRRNLPRGWARVRKDRLEAITFALADEAYLQFGQREKSEANDLCTRKFLRDMISEYDSLRAKEKNIVLTKALSLSYVGPAEIEDAREFESTNCYGKRATTSKTHRF